jgi:8-oxo-dGTP diphosphatase
VRHARAGDRASWVGDDRLRPLDERGREQARRLVERLAGTSPARIVSSPYVRCVETVEPLAAACGLAVETSAALAEGAGKAEVDALLGSATEGLVLCTHGDVVELVLGRGLRKGEAVLLEQTGPATFRSAGRL